MPRTTAARSTILRFRRSLITIGEDVVNIAYDAPLDMPPQAQIEDTERRLFALAENGRYDGGFQSFNDAVALAVDMAGAAFERDGNLSGISTGIMSLDGKMGGLQRSDLIILAGRPGMGKTSLATNIAWNIAAAYEPEVMPGRKLQGQERRRRRLLLARNVLRTARHPYHVGADGSLLLQDPPRRHHRA